MEDISVIKKKTFELKQYANAILEDLDIKLAEERESYKASIDEISESKDKEIGNLNSLLTLKDSEISSLEKEKDELKLTVRNIKKSIGTAIEICEGAE